MEKRMNERQRDTIIIGMAIGVGFMLGVRYQKRINLKTLNALKKTTISLVKNPNPMFPAAMPIEEVKKVLQMTPNTKILGEAVIVEMDGLQKWIIR